jgi:hypothetical protein
MSAAFILLESYLPLTEYERWPNVRATNKSDRTLNLKSLEFIRRRPIGEDYMLNSNKVRTSDIVGIIARSPRRTQMVKQELLEKLLMEAASIDTALMEKDSGAADRAHLTGVVAESAGNQKFTLLSCIPRLLRLAASKGWRLLTSKVF